MITKIKTDSYENGGGGGGEISYCRGFLRQENILLQK